MSWTSAVENEEISDNHTREVGQENEMAKDIALEIKNVTVAYRSYQQRPTSLKESIIRFFRHGQIRYYSTFDALSKVSCQVRKGAVYGIIGSNGSGKSTLLKVISGVLKPTEGSVHRQGSIASLIELGAGFDPELNAIENIYLNGSLHKKPKADIRKRVSSILDFAELHEFASTPVKYYSSGMYARLGFSVAIDLNPDILLVDEILAVGDERFQTKCAEVFRRFKKEGKTIIIISHSMQQIEDMTEEALLLSKGHVVFQGSPATAIQKYREGEYETALK